MPRSSGRRAAAKGVFTPASLAVSDFADAGSGVYTLAAGSVAAATDANWQQLLAAKGKLGALR